MIKGSIQEEDIAIVNIYAPNIGAPQYKRQTLTDINKLKDNNHIIISIDAEKYITIVNIYAPYIGAPQDIRQTLTDIKGETDSSTIIVGDFNIPPTPVEWTDNKNRKLIRKHSLK